MFMLIHNRKRKILYVQLKKTIKFVFFSFRHYRYEQTLAGLLWKVDMKEVTVINLGEYNNPSHKNIVCKVLLIYISKYISNLCSLIRFKYVAKVFLSLENQTKDHSQILVRVRNI